MRENEDILLTIMGLISNGGDAKSNLMEAIAESKTGNFNNAEEKFSLAEESLLKAHTSQTKMLTEEASGNSSEVSLLMVHAQDHLMNAITLKDVTREIIDIHKRIDQIKDF